MTFVVTAALVVAAGADGTLGYHYQGQPINWLSAEDAQRLIADGMIEKATAAPTLAADAEETVTDGGDGANQTPTGAIERPAPTDPKPEWIAYGIAAGLDADAVEGMTKPQIAAAVDALNEQ
ncbi:hypothetical protein [Prescottella equi]|uniref:hypothetical protein n=1 Tax=Rhodococcus hoagii TaxID=43767 RepID=UPI0007CD8655|nr:hypothetical protein [Prescottella equi]ORL01560.1 hypothetical protein A6F56_04370 [Prescottella equi]